MSPEHLIIHVYCLVHDAFQKVCQSPLRLRGENPSLSDPELITIEIVGEYLGFGSDQAIWRYFHHHWRHLFPDLPCRTSFVRQSANLGLVKTQMQVYLSESLGQDKDLYLVDGFPIPICHIKRYKRSKSMLTPEGTVGYCASKDEHYYGFKGHVMILQNGAIRAYEMAPAKKDERDLLVELINEWHIHGDVLGDKGLLSAPLKQELQQKDLHLHTPLRDNMKDDRPKDFVNQIMDIRRKVETVIGQLTERFRIQCIRAKDLWHLCVKVARKFLAHTVCFMINQKLNPAEPLQLELLLA